LSRSASNSTKELSRSVEKGQLSELSDALLTQVSIRTIITHCKLDY